MTGSLYSDPTILACIAVVISGPIIRGSRWIKGVSKRRRLFFSIIQTVISTALMMTFLFAMGIDFDSVGLTALSTRQLWLGAVSSSVVVVMDACSLRMLLNNESARRQAIASIRMALPATKAERIPILALLVCSAIWEELAFRGTAYFIGEHFHLPLALTIALSSTVFSLQHGERGVDRVLGRFVFGTVFFAIFLLSGSLYPAIVAHFVGNLFVVMVTYPNLLARERSGASQTDESISIPF